MLVGVDLGIGTYNNTESRRGKSEKSRVPQQRNKSRFSNRFETVVILFKTEKIHGEDGLASKKLISTMV